MVQPLHVGFTSDRGGNTIDVKWYTTKTVLHHVSSNFPLNKLLFFQNLFLIHTLQVWDNSIIETAEEKLYDSNVDELINTLQTNITVLLPLLTLHPSSS